MRALAQVPKVPVHWSDERRIADPLDRSSFFYMTTTIKTPEQLNADSLFAFQMAQRHADRLATILDQWNETK